MILTVEQSFIVAICLLLTSSVKCQECSPVPNTPPCVCAMPSGETIDLRSLAHHDGTAAFNKISLSDSESDTTYSYNPCYPFTDGNCKDVAGCENSYEKFSLGTQDKAIIHTNDDGAVYITYDGGKSERSMTVNLVCGQNAKTGELKYTGVTEDKDYKFTLTTECACPGTCNGGGGAEQHHHSSSSEIGVVGLVILSVFVIIIIVYFVAGMIIMRVKYDKTGTDIIPNKAFWISLPFLVKDGCVFTCTPCTHYCSRRCKGYSNV